MTLSWIMPSLATALALLEAQKPERGAGAYPQTSPGPAYQAPSRSLSPLLFLPQYPPWRELIVFETSELLDYFTQGWLLISVVVLLERSALTVLFNVQESH